MNNIAELFFYRYIYYNPELKYEKHLHSSIMSFLYDIFPCIVPHITWKPHHAHCKHKTFVNFAFVLITHTYTHMHKHTCTKIHMHVCQPGHCLYLGISRSHENTETARIYMSRNWWYWGVIESSLDLSWLY